MAEPQNTPPPKPTPRSDARRILRRLQGEDGYEIFNDRKGANARDRLRREYEDSRP